MSAELAHSPDMAFDPREKSRLRPLWFDEIGHDTTADYIIKGILSDGGLSMIYGPPSCGKSFLATDMALAVARGVPWFNRRVRGGGVLYIAAEGQGGFKKRISAYRQAHLSEEDTGIPFALLPVPVNLLQGTDGSELVKLVLERCPNGAPIRLVIVDTLARTMIGGDENNPQDMSRYVSSLSGIGTATGAHVCVIHHSGKNEAVGARGHSSLLGAVDTAIKVAKEENARTATIEKQKDGKNGDGFAFDLDTVGLGQDQDGDSVTSCVVRALDGENAPAEARNARKPLKPAPRQALALLHECIISHGIAAPTSSHIPCHVRGVTKQHWREFLSKGGLINESGNPREQMRRLLVTLKDQSVIGVWGDFVWPVTSVTEASQ